MITITESMRLFAIFLLLLCLARHASEQSVSFSEDQCVTYEVSKGEIGEGKLSYCDNGIEQEIYLSGELDIRPTDRSERNAADLIAVKKIVREFKEREKGTFRVVTNNAGGGETEWHQKLIMAVEDACIEDCRIVTEIRGRCESACNQLHTTCVRNARTIVHTQASTWEHATTDEDNPRCKRRDPFVAGETDLCDSQVAVHEYKERCGELTKGRDLDLDADRRKQVYEFIDRLARNGVFDTTRLTCTSMPWAEAESTTICGASIR